jgi:hypothetical protein
MGDDFDFRTMLRGPRPKPRGARGNVVRLKRRSQRAGKVARLLISGLLLGSLLGIVGLHWSGNLPDWGKRPAEGVTALSPSFPSNIGCMSPTVVDGDTLRCGSTRIRLSSIDAPEMPGHCRPGRECTPGDPYASRANLRSLTAGAAVECRQIDTDVYGRAIALCRAGGRDLSCAQYESGHAIERYGSLSC